MFPGIYEFHWDTGHLIFMGALYLVLAIIGLTMITIVYKVIMNFRNKRVEAVMWQEDFHDLSQSVTRCRYEITGRMASRACSGGFDCRVCEFAAGMVPETGETSPASPAAAVDESESGDCFGYNMPVDRLYHRGHTWVQEQEDGTYLIGMDDFGNRLIGKHDRLAIPPIGSELEVNGTGWQIYKGDQKIRILAPLDGKVVSVGGPEVGWWLRVKPLQKNPDLRHLLSGDEIKPWVLRELERLQGLLFPGLGAIGLADGGAPVEDVTADCSEAERNSIWGDIFLEG